MDLQFYINPFCKHQQTLIKGVIMQHQYWIAGATWNGGNKDVLPDFIRRGYWYCWDINKFKNKESSAGNSIKQQQERFTKIKIDDRIAIKRLKGKGADKMSILAIGVVKDIDISEWRVYVDWILTDIQDRNVPLAGCISAIHGPFKIDSPNADYWLNQIFCL